MSESIVDASHVEEIVTQVLTQFVQDGDDEDQMSVELLQEQVELHLEYDSGSLSKWHNSLGHTLRDFFNSKNPVSVHTPLTWSFKSPQPDVVPRHRPHDGMVWNDTGNPIRRTSY